MKKKKSPNKQVVWSKGFKCPNCGKCNWQFIKEFKLKGKRYIHLICGNCMCEDIKTCDFTMEEAKRMLSKNDRR